MPKIDPNSQLYQIVFKPKNKRKNKRDDKVEIARSVAQIEDTNNYVDLWKLCVKTAHSEYKHTRYDKDKTTLVDINLYDMPYLHVRLNDDQYHKLRKHEDIYYVSKPPLRYISAETIPWGITRIGALTLDPTTHHRGYGVKVANLDTGVDYNHVDLKPNYKGGIATVDYTTDTMDDNTLAPDGKTVANTFHGTHTCGTIAAAINNAGVVGVSPECYLYEIKAGNQSGAFTGADVTEGFVWALANHMHVFSTSITGPGFDATENNAVQALLNDGCPIAAAAGNNGKAELGYPAAYAGVCGVGALDQNDQKASFSQTGAHVFFSGPGVGVESDMPGNRLHTLDGTSMATPHIAGVMALAVANYRFTPCNTTLYNPANSKRIQLIAAMIQACDTLGQTTPAVRSNQIGFGMPLADQTVKILLDEV